MNKRYITNNVAIDEDSVIELGNNGLLGDYRRILCEARTVDGELVWYVETNGDPEWVNECEPWIEILTRAEALEYFENQENEQNELT